MGKSKVNKGEKGEHIVSTLLKLVFKDNFFLFNNFTILDKLQMSHQIDHILVSKKGVFVVETKNIHNLILGGKEKPLWNVICEKDYMIKNPFYQNKNHVYYVSKLLNTDYVFNIVLFVCNPFVKRLGIKEVMNAKDVFSYIRNNFKKDIFDEKQVQKFNEILLKKDKKLDAEEHVTNIFGRQACVKNHICPICGGELKLIQFKSSQFIGCQNYPKCNFVASNRRNIF